VTKPIWHQHKLDIVAALKPASKRKPRGVVARFLAGEGFKAISWKWKSPAGYRYDFAAAEAILRRALAKKGGKR